MIDPARRAAVLGCLALACATASGATARGPAQLSAGDHVAALGGVELAYHVRGDGPVLIVHPGGPGNSSAYLRASLSALERFATLVYVDPVGTGASSRLAPGTYTHEAYAAHVEALRAHLGVERVWLLGHSYGGEVALVYAYTHPDRVAGLILYSTSPRYDAEWLEDRRVQMRARAGEPWYADASAAGDELELVTTGEQGAAVLRRIVPFAFADYTHHREEYAPVVAAIDWALEPNLPWPDGPDGRFDLRPMLSRIRAPTLILAGRQDWVCGPKYAEELRRGIAGSRVHVFAESGHFAHVEEADAFAEVVRTFVEETRDARATPTARGRGAPRWRPRRKRGSSA